MSATSRVSATAVSGGTAPAGWVSSGDRRGLSAPIDPASSNSFFSVGDYWQRYYGEAANDQGNLYPFKKQQEAQLFTPLVGRMASSFVAADPVTDIRLSPGLFMSELRRVISLYEYSMRVTGDNLDFQGSLVNSYS